MKIENLVKANELATKWRYLISMDRTLRDAPWLVLTGLSIPAQINGGIDLMDFMHAGIDVNDINDQVRDLVAEILDRQASILLDEMKAIGLDTEHLAVEREDMVRAADEKEKARKAR